MDQPRRILYIDDDAGIRRLVDKQLGRRGHAVVGASSGAEGIELARTGTFDVVAVDHYMPGMDGLTTLKALRELSDPPPIVYVTGSEESSVAVAALKGGAHEYVVKSAGEDFVNLLEQGFAHALARSRLEKEKQTAEQALVISNERLQTMLREVNHRVANSLQIVSTMVGMQARLLPDGQSREALADTQRRIDAIAQVHRKLYSSGDVQSVAMDEYLAVLVTELEETWSSPAAPREIRLQAESLRLHTDKAVSLGVIVNELVSNACKYAYGESDPGEVRVVFRRENDDRFRLVVEDDGRGMNGEISVCGTGLGSKLIDAMARSLSTIVHYDPGHRGVRAVLTAAI